MRLELFRCADGAVVFIDQDHQFRHLIHATWSPQDVLSNTCASSSALTFVAWTLPGGRSAGADDMKSGPCSSARSARPCDPFTRDTRRGPLNLIKHSSSFTPLSPDNLIISDMGVVLAAQCRP